MEQSLGGGKWDGKTFDYFFDNIVISKPDTKGLITVKGFLTTAHESLSIAIQGEKESLVWFGALPQPRREKALEVLLSDYVQRQAIDDSRKYHGKHTPFSTDAWRTARVLAKPLISWASTQKTHASPPYKDIIKRLRRQKYRPITPRLVACYLLRLNVENLRLYKNHDSMWLDYDPCLELNEFFKILNKRPAGKWNDLFIRGNPPINLTPNNLRTIVQSNKPEPIVQAILNGVFLFVIVQPGVLTTGF